MPKLNVNVDHVATVRQARGGNEPDPVLAAHLAELAGAQGIVVHLREDRRHIQERDVRVLRETVRTKLNMEMAPTEEMVRIAAEVKPDMVTLVPEKRQELTTEGGLDVSGNLKAVTASVKALRNSGIPVSLFIDPEAKQISASVKTGADMVEFHTGSYAEAKNEKSAESELNKIKKAVKKALSGGLSVAAGHGLNYVNTGAVARIKGIEEFNIGHSIVSRSLMVGMERAVSDMVKIIG